MAEAEAALLARKFIDALHQLGWLLQKKRFDIRSCKTCVPKSGSSTSASEIGGTYRFAAAE